MLKITNLSAGYGGTLIIRKVTMEVREKEIVTLIGPNGAGKSTVLRSIFGLCQLEEGGINYLGKSLVGLSPEQIVRNGITYDPQGRSIFPSLSVQENLEMGAYLNKKIDQERFDYVYEKFPCLKERRSQRSKTLSGGEQHMLAIARALMMSPELLLLDEPSIGLAPKIIAEVFLKLREIRDSGVSILMVEQNATQALAISDRAYVLELGRIRYEGKGGDLLKDPKVGELYLGNKKS